MIEMMDELGIPVTRKGWLELNYPDGVPKVLTAEQELEIPADLTDEDEEQKAFDRRQFHLSRGQHGGSKTSQS